MQIQANLLDVEVIRPDNTETTALGAAFFAGLATGYWNSIDSLSEIWKINQRFEPIQNKETQKIIDLWEKRIINVGNS